jgi:hypothetical protein
LPPKQTLRIGSTDFRQLPHFCHWLAPAKLSQEG